MASYAAWRPILFVVLCGYVCVSTSSVVFLPPVNASSVKIGYIWEHPRFESHDALEAVMTDRDKVLRLVCVISPPLPQTNEYFEHRDKLVKWRKVAPIEHKPSSLQYWSVTNSRTALSFPNVTLDVLGTYSCSYGGITRKIDVVVADAKAAEQLRKPKSLEEFEEYVMYRKDKTSFKSWKSILTLNPAQDVGEHKFHCPVRKKRENAQSVHQLHPSDITIVAAVGDSLTTGLGARATSLNGYFSQFRGISWSIGGDRTLEKFTTLPNILKMFSPALKGFSMETGDQSSTNTNLNLATTSSGAKDLMIQAKELIRKLKTDKSFQYEKEWKLLTLWIGTADLCQLCEDQEQFSPRYYIKYVMQTLSYLHKEVPKMFVNLVVPMNVSELYHIRNRQSCTLEGWNACSCVHGSEVDRQSVEKAAKEYTRLLKELVDSGLYDTRDDFTVVIQPFMNSPPKSKNGEIAQDLFGQDCFHFSSKGHEAAAVALWNNMLEAVGLKSESWSGYEKLVCPSEMQPYLATRLNSKTFLKKVQDNTNFERTSDDDEMLPVASVALSVFLTVVVVCVAMFVLRSRRSRSRSTPNKLQPISPHPFKPTI